MVYIAGIQLGRLIMLLRSIVFSFFVCFSLASCAADNDFDTVCSVFKALQASPNLAKLSPQQRQAFVTEHIDKMLDKSSAARISWEAVAAADPDQRYEIFKSGAEDVLGKSWECESMRQLAATAGE